MWNLSSVISSYSFAVNPPNKKIRGKIKKGKVKISRRMKAKRDDFESNLNLNSSSGEPTIFNGRRPVHNMNFKRNMKKYLVEPERCSN